MKTIFRSYYWICCCIFFSVSINAQENNDTLIIGFSLSEPFIVKKNDKLEGINIWLWEKIASELQIKFKYKQLNFNNMIESIENGTIDVSIDPLTVTSNRSKNIDFTFPYYVSNSSIVIHEASSMTIFYNFISTFFNKNFLKGFFILFLINVILGGLMWQFEKKNNSKEFRKSWKGFWDGFWWSAVTMTTVGYGDKSPKSRGGKITALLWMFSGLLFISGLTASVASSLTVNKLKNQSDQILEFKNHAVGTIDKSSAQDYLKDHLFTNIKVYNDVPSGLLGVKNHHIDAFIYDEPLLKYFLKNEQDNKNLINLQLLNSKFDLQLYAFGLNKKNKQLTEVISQKILEIVESHKWKILLNDNNLPQM